MKFSISKKVSFSTIQGFTLITLLVLQGCVIDPELIGSVKDIDGNRYGTREIGQQTWMTSNLKTTRYTDGTLIPLVEDSVKWKTATTPAFCWYDNNSSSMSYGGLYNFYVFDTVANGGRKLCPAGWHVPTLDEWNQLIEFAGGYSQAGFTLKDREFSELSMKSEYPANPYGFSALSGGYRSGVGRFDARGEWASFWTSTSTSSSAANGLLIVEDVSTISLNTKLSKKIGSSVRCIKD